MDQRPCWIHLPGGHFPPTATAETRLSRLVAQGVHPCTPLPGGAKQSFAEVHRPALVAASGKGPWLHLPGGDFTPTATLKLG